MDTNCCPHSPLRETVEAEGHWEARGSSDAHAEKGDRHRHTQKFHRRTLYLRSTSTSTL